MDRTSRRGGAVALTVLALAGMLPLAAPSALAAQPPPLGERATVSVYRGGVDFRPEVSHEGGVLTVSGGEHTFTLTFGAGEAISIGAYDAEGYPLPDGLYSWELELRPDKMTRLRLMAAASANGGEAPEAWLPQSGTFTVVYGSIVEPDGIEAEPVRIEALPLGQIHLDLVPQSTAIRGGGAGEDSDRAVEAGTVESRERTTEIAAKRALTTAFVVPNPSADSDSTTTSSGGTLERQFNQSAEPSSRALAGRRAKPADGSSGREPGSTPDK